MIEVFWVHFRRIWTETLNPNNETVKVCDVPACDFVWLFSLELLHISLTHSTTYFRVYAVHQVG